MDVNGTGVLVGVMGGERDGGVVCGERDGDREKCNGLARLAAGNVVGTLTYNYLMILTISL